MKIHKFVCLDEASVNGHVKTAGENTQFLLRFTFNFKN